MKCLKSTMGKSLTVHLWKCITCYGVLKVYLEVIFNCPMFNCFCWSTETLRKYPPVPVLTRDCTETYKIPDSDLVILKGQTVFFPILGIQYDPEHYPDPERFDPDRFTNEGKSTRHPFTWLPFGEGPRNCIGKVLYISNIPCTIPSSLCIITKFFGIN